jgi:SAM-dependent methyltransferase
MDRAEFDKFADEYRAIHARNISASGETPEFFAEYKIADTRRLAAARGVNVQAILDFGCGVGTSTANFLQKFGSDVRICGADVSEKSLEIARARFSGQAEFSAINGVRIPFEDKSFDVAFAACVFHHIPWEEHAHWLSEVRRVMRPGGMLIIFEHNPWNPLTVRAVNTCEFDENARLMTPLRLRKLFGEAGWNKIGHEYRIFYPRSFARLRFTEKWLNWLPLGAQYSVAAQA